MSDQDKISAFVSERDAALLSLDEEKIRAFYFKWNRETLPEGIVFWGAIHKAITGSKGLPLDFRKKSKQWLTEHKMQSLDDGELND